MLQNFVSGSNVPVDKIKGTTGVQGTRAVVGGNAESALGKSASIFAGNLQDVYYLTMPGSRVPSHQEVNSVTQIPLQPSQETLTGYIALDSANLINEFDRLAAINTIYSEFLLKQSGDAGSSRFLADTTILSMLTLEARMQTIEDILRSRQN